MMDSSLIEIIKGCILGIARETTMRGVRVTHDMLGVIGDFAGTMKKAKSENE